MGDRYLIWRFKRGSAEAFERIYERHKNDLLKLAVVLLGDVHAAEDIVHDVFVHVARTRANLQVTGNLTALLATSVANRARNYRRDAYRRCHWLARQADGEPATACEPQQWAILSEQLHSLTEAMAQLPVGSDWRYAGADAVFGDATRPIFWYRPEGSMTYRVIYADLSILDVAPADLPK